MTLYKTAIATALVASFAVPTAHATLVFSGPVDLQGTGLGNVSTILTLQARGQSTSEAGAVVADGAGQATTGDTIAINSLRTFGELGVSTAEQLAIIFNPSEPQNEEIGIDLNELVLSIYGPTTDDLVFSSGAITPVSLDAVDAGTGNAGYLFLLDNAQATAVNAVLASAGANAANYRIGLASSLTNAHGGVETFFAAQIPEPGTWAIIAAGLLAVGGLARRRLFQG